MENIKFSDLPSIGSQLDNGIFAGIITQKDGTHVAVVLLPNQASKINWVDAKAWATSVGGTLPTRQIASMLVANPKTNLLPEWHWVLDEWSDDYAWSCNFGNSVQGSIHKSVEGSAVAVRLISIMQ